MSTVAAFFGNYTVSQKPILDISAVTLE